MQVIALAEIRRPDLRWPLPERMAERLTGQRVERLRRRSKYILVDLSSGETPADPPWHVGADADFRRRFWASSTTTIPHREKHDHVILTMAGGARITFNDARRFGAMDLMPTERAESHPLLASLGPEPLGN